MISNMGSLHMPYIVYTYLVKCKTYIAHHAYPSFIVFIKFASLLHHNNVNTLVKYLDNTAISAAYKLTVEKKDVSDPAAVFMELKSRSLQGEANKVKFHLILLCS